MQAGLRLRLQGSHIFWKPPLLLWPTALLRLLPAASLYTILSFVSKFIIEESQGGLAFWLAQPALVVSLTFNSGPILLFIYYLFFIYATATQQIILLMLLFMKLVPVKTTLHIIYLFFFYNTVF